MPSTSLARLRDFVATAAPPALDLIVNGLQSHSEQVRGGHRSALLAKPEARPAPIAPEPTRQTFTLAHVCWLDRDGQKKTSAKHRPFSSAAKGYRGPAQGRSSVAFLA